MWCVIECGSEGEIFEPEFFKTKTEAIKYIMDDSEECYAMYSDFPDIQTDYDHNEFEAQVVSGYAGNYYRHHWKIDKFEV